MNSKTYVAPSIEVIEIEIETAVLTGSPTGERFGTQTTPDMDWI